MKITEQFTNRVAIAVGAGTTLALVLIAGAGCKKSNDTPTKPGPSGTATSGKDVPSAEQPSGQPSPGNQFIKVPPRDPAAGTNLIDLTAHYNAALTETWHPGSNMAGDSGNDLSELPRGVHKLADVQFDLRGVIQVSTDGTGNRHGPYPKAVEGIRIGFRCQALHFLHGTGFVDNDGQKIGSYCVHFTDGQVQEIPIVYGEDVRDWWAYGQMRSDTKRAVVAWTGQNAATKSNNISLQLYRLTWRNPRPEVMIESIDFKASPARSIPFLVAITAEP